MVRKEQQEEFIGKVMDSRKNMDLTRILLDSNLNSIPHGTATGSQTQMPIGES